MPVPPFLRSVGGAIATLVLLASLVFGAWWIELKGREAVGWVEHSHKVLAEVDRLEASLYRAEAGQRGFFISGQARYLEDRNQALGELGKAEAELLSLTADNPGQQAQAQVISRDITLRLHILEDYLTLFEEKGLAATGAAFGKGMEVSRRIRAGINEFRAEENALLAQRLAQAQRAATQRKIGVLVLLALAVLGFGLSSLLMARNTRERKVLDDRNRELLDILEATPDFVTIVDPDGRYRYLNRAVRQRMGIPPFAEARFFTLEQLHPEAELQLLKQEAMPEAVRSGSWQGETKLQSPSGDRIPVSKVLVAHGHGDGEVTFSAISRDIGGRVKAEAEAAEAARVERTVTEALALINRHGALVPLMEGFFQLLAERHGLPVGALYLQEEMGGELVLAASRALPEGSPLRILPGVGLVGATVKERTTRVLQGPGNGLTLETPFGPVSLAAQIHLPLLFKGQLLGVLALGSEAPLAEGTQRMLERLAVHLGITLRNLQQAETERLLAGELQARGREILEKNRQLEEASRSKTEFLANMSHELRTPLNAIIGFSELLKDGMVGQLDVRQTDCVKDIFDSGCHLLGLINDILDLSKIEAGRMTVELDALRVDDLAELGLTVIREKAAATGIKVAAHVQPGLGRVLVDSRKVKQILYNLLSNAVKFTPERGQVLLDLSRVPSACVVPMATDPQVREFLPHPGDHDWFQIQVQDSGIGIAPGDLARLFEPFVQLDSSLARQHQGTGLGLAMVRRLAELHGGGLRLQSREGEGSTFTVWLPWRDEEAESIRPAEQRSAPAGAQAPLVLFVEDDPQARALVRAQLDEAGFRVATLNRAEGALEEIRRLRPEAILLDILLPGQDGWNLLRSLKEDPSIADIPAVIVSITDEEALGLSLGATSVLVKPVSKAQLLQALASAGLVAARGGRILVVDDDPKAVTLLSGHLREAGFLPIEAHRGQEGVELARSQRPDLIILDLMMPDISGFDVLDGLHADPSTRNIPILVLTAKDLTQDEEVTLRAKVSQVLRKMSFDPPTFVRAVREALAAAGSPRKTP